MGGKERGAGGGGQEEFSWDPARTNLDGKCAEGSAASGGSCEATWRGILLHCETNQILPTRDGRGPFPFSWRRRNPGGTLRW